MKKVLIIITTGFASYGGLTTVMMNYYRAMDKSGLKIDFASTNEAADDLVEELNRNSSRYFCLGDRKKHLYKYIKNLRSLLKSEQYDVIHVNGNSATMCLELSTAKHCGVKTRIAHGHTTGSSYKAIGFAHKYLQSYFKSLCNYRLAVSDYAGKWLYGDDYEVINNAIEVSKYAFNDDVRISCRKNLQIENQFVLGHLGKLYEPKNHEFLLKVFCVLKQKCPDTVLLLVGGGHLESKLKEQCKNLDIKKSVIFTGMVDNPSEYLQAMDVFVFPSLYEGFPLSLIEAQTNGLPCIVSDTITRNAKIADNVVYKSLNDGIDSWAEKVLSIINAGCKRNINARKDVSEHGFDIKKEAGKLLKIYLT